MKSANRNELRLAATIGLFSGGLSGGVALILHFGFDRNTTFAFLGAIVGGAAVVLLSVGEQERVYRNAKERELQQIEKYFRATKMALSDALGPPFKKDENGILSIGGCYTAISLFRNLQRFLEQAIDHATHVDFWQRSELTHIHGQCDHLVSKLEKYVKFHENVDGVGNHLSPEDDIRLILNMMNLFTSLKSINP